MARPRTDDFLAHYGVKGMKWGKRKDGSGGSSKPATPNSEDHEKSRASSTKKASQLSNKELKDLNERLQLETTYKRLQAESKTVSKGKKFVKSSLAATKTINEVIKVVDSPAGKLVVKAMKDSAEAAARRRAGNLTGIGS